MKTSENLDKILPALASVKSNLSGVKKGTKNTFFKSSYADLNSHLDAVEELLENNGLVLLQPTTNSPEGNVVSSRIYHTTSGQYVESSMKLVGETDMQKAGSAITYARGYTLGSLLSMQAVDDDGNAASGKTAPVKTESKVTTTTVTPKTEAKIEAAPTNKPSFRDRNKKTATAVPTAPVVTETITSNGDDL